MQLAGEELNFPNLIRLGERETLIRINFLSIRSIATLLLQLSLILVCVALCFRVAQKSHGYAVGWMPKFIEERE